MLAAALLMLVGMLPCHQRRPSPVLRLRRSDQDCPVLECYYGHPVCPPPRSWLVLAAPFSFETQLVANGRDFLPLACLL